MATKVTVPELGESINEVILVEWLKKDGDLVNTDEPLCVVETDKANVEIPSPASGVLHTQIEPESSLQVGDTLGTIDPNGKASRAADKEPASKSAAKSGKEEEAGGDVIMSPAVRRLIREHDLDPSLIKPTGRGDRLTQEDVTAYLDAQKEKEVIENSEPEPAPVKSKQKTPAIQTSNVPVAGLTEDEGVRRQPMSKIRRTIAHRLLAAQQNAAMLTTFNEIDMHELLDLRKRHKEHFEKVHGVSLGLTSFFGRAVVLALRESPELNGRIEGDDIIYHGFIHLAFAVSTEHGLVTPVLRHAEEKSLAQMEIEIQRMAKAARAGRLSIQELGGGTFTITNGGVFGSLLSTPMLNPPQSGILGMHTIQKRPVVIDDEIVIRPMMYTALTYDHRLIDGKEAVGFLVRIKQFLEDPGRLLLEV